MISLEDRPIVHEFIVLDLAIRSLQQDYTKLEGLKMHAFYSRWTDLLMKNLNEAYIVQKRQLANKRIRIVRWMKIDAYFSDVIIATAGEDIVLRYANQALKTEVEQLLIQKATSV
ncbi:aconitate hydratase [Solibacillus sp. R5-41]|uniref:aconitate hydratase n=1 Tax=Solibacillus sp. R5-41 TaxID=2048654 RepID=UPI000C12975F|nr:aconitate hydratase [Solibacillus sp. R5-41]ATP39508.1 aconitate hydratase [Solibacillus sp. R5-41]